MSSKIYIFVCRLSVQNNQIFCRYSWKRQSVPIFMLYKKYIVHCVAWGQRGLKSPRIPPKSKRKTNNEKINRFCCTCNISRNYFIKANQGAEDLFSFHIYKITITLSFRSYRVILGLNILFEKVSKRTKQKRAERKAQTLFFYFL